MLLSNNERFLKEYNEIKGTIENISDLSLKNELGALLKDLVKEVKIIDQQHQEIFVTKTLSNSVSDHRNNISQIRKKIFSKITDYKNKGLIPKSLDDSKILDTGND